VNSYQLHCYNAKGLEIGGPSQDLFVHGIYNVIGSLDGVNFGSNVWQGDLSNGQSQFKFLPNRTGYLYLCEGSHLTPIPSDSYTVVLSCHNLEHIANPIKALEEWIRVLKPGGKLFLVLPKKENTFDYKRPTTTLDHLISDYNNDVGEDDLTHLEEILKLHDLSKDPEAGDFVSFVKRSLVNVDNRCLHHHVFDRSLIVTMFKYLGIELLLFKEEEAFYVVGQVSK